MRSGAQKGRGATRGDRDGRTTAQRRKAHRRHWRCGHLKLASSSCNGSSKICGLSFGVVHEIPDKGRAQGSRGQHKWTRNCGEMQVQGPALSSSWLLALDWSRAAVARATGSRKSPALLACPFECDSHHGIAGEPGGVAMVVLGRSDWSKACGKTQGLSNLATRSPSNRR